LASFVSLLLFIFLIVTMNSYDILFLLDNQMISILEIQDLNAKETDPIDQIFYWILYDKQQDKLEQLEFQSMKSHDGIEERWFKQGQYLKFTDQSGEYTNNGIDENYYHQRLTRQHDRVLLSGKCRIAITDFLNKTHS